MTLTRTLSLDDAHLTLNRQHCSPASSSSSSTPTTMPPSSTPGTMNLTMPMDLPHVLSPSQLNYYYNTNTYYHHQKNQMMHTPPLPAKSSSSAPSPQHYTHHQLSQQQQQQQQQLEQLKKFHKFPPPPPLSLQLTPNNGNNNHHTLFQANATTTYATHASSSLFHYPLVPPPSTTTTTPTAQQPKQKQEKPSAWSTINQQSTHQQPQCQPLAYHQLSQVPEHKYHYQQIQHKRIELLSTAPHSTSISPPVTYSSILCSEHHDVIVGDDPSTTSSPSSSSSSSTTTAAASNKYKTELCRSYYETGACRYGKKCRFAHGRQELKSVVRHSKFKSELCYNYHYCSTCVCPYGVRCCFLHEIPIEFLGKAIAENIDSIVLFQSNLRLKAFENICSHQDRDSEKVDVGNEEQVGMMTMCESKSSSHRNNHKQQQTRQKSDLSSVSVCCDDGCGAAAEEDDVEVDSYDYGDCCRDDESKVTPIELKKQVREPCIMDE